MGNDEAALLRLWREKRGETGPEDLSGNLIVQLGLATEELNRRWYQAQHRSGHHGRPAAGLAPRPPLDGGNARRPGGAGPVRFLASSHARYPFFNCRFRRPRGRRRFRR